MTSALLGGVPTAEAIPRGVNRLSFDARNGDVTRIINCSPELGHLIFTSDVALLEAPLSLSNYDNCRKTRRPQALESLFPDARLYCATLLPELICTRFASPQ